jgi:hypothetical protein
LLAQSVCSLLIAQKLLTEHSQKNLPGNFPALNYDVERSRAGSGTFSTLIKFSCRSLAMHALPALAGEHSWQAVV